MRIFLVRHGQSQGNVDMTIHESMADHAIPLSERGKVQAQETGAWLGQYLDDQEPTDHLRLWTSPYKRTRQTADGIELGLNTAARDHITDRREHILLCEQQFGLFDGIPDDQLPTRYPDEHAHYAKQEAFEGRFWARMPLGESRFDVATRVHQSFGTFQRDLLKYGIRDLIVVCHGVTLRAFVMMWLNLSPEWFEDEPNPNNCAIRLIDEYKDWGYVFPGFSRDG